MTGEDDREWAAMCRRLTRGQRSQRAPASTPWSFDVGPLLADRGGNLSLLAASLGVGRETIHRKRRTGLTDVEADRWAMACGLHPLEVWGDLWLRDW